MIDGDRSEEPRGGFDAVLQHLTQEIESGRVGAGSLLPNERKLAEDLHVSRGAVREAIKVLQAQGIVTSRVGQGGGTRIATTQGSALGGILRLHMALEAISFQELTDTRVVLERAAAATAAGNVDSDVLEELCARMEHEEEIDRFNDLDTAFHVEIARLGNNRLVRDLTIAIRQAVASHILIGERAVAKWEPFRANLVHEHRHIISALRSGDGNLAADLTEAHVRRSHFNLLKVQSHIPQHSAVDNQLRASDEARGSST